MSTLIENYEDYIFIIFMNNHESLIIIYDVFFQFFHKRYFSRYVFKFIYLTEFKILMFINILKVLKFEENAKGL